MSETQKEIESTGLYSIAQIETFNEFLATGDIARAAQMFAAPKEVVVQWVRTQLAYLAKISKSDKVKVECWKALLNDLNGQETSPNVRVELVLKNSQGEAIGVKVVNGNQDQA